MLSITIILFLFGAGALMASVFVYSKHDDTAFTQTLMTIKTLQGRVNELEKLLQSNIQTVGSCNIKCDSVIKMVETVSKNCEDLHNETGDLQAMCLKLKEKDMELQEKISSKRPIIKFPEAVPVQLVPGRALGKGVKSLIKENKKDQ